MPKTSSLGISKMWSTPLKLTEILGNFFHIPVKNLKNQMLNISVNFKDIKKVNHISETHLTLNLFLDALYVIY